jgi:hypothetical protein
MSLDLDIMRSLHENSVAAAAVRAHGPGADDLVRRLLSALPTVHAQLPVQMLPNGLVVFVALDDADATEEASGTVPDLRGVLAYPHEGFTVQVTSDGYRVRPAATAVEDLPNAIAYRFTHPRLETWHVDGQELVVVNPTTDQPSVFASPLFTKLEEALDHYAHALVLDCRCLTLQAAWLDDRRVYWKQRPEEEIRRSLEQHLVSALRAVVEVEHVVDERKEADVLVFWAFSTQGAIIECKWLGVSASTPDASAARKITRFSPAEAVAGLGQLADYLDRKRARAAGRSFRGHLVVIDGRRRRAADPDDGRVFTPADLVHYEHRDITWPAELLARTDVAAPRRMFCRPKL